VQGACRERAGERAGTVQVLTSWTCEGQAHGFVAAPLPSAFAERRFRGRRLA
jgi:hypothetical protein